MIGLLIACLAFNAIAFTTNKRLTKNQIIHIWMFTMAFQLIVDLFMEQKYHGYWYFSKDVEWKSIPAFTLLIPPVNIIFINWYPFDASFYKRILYVSLWVVAITFYESITTLPEPWGYFNHGWWKLRYSAAINPFLLMIVVLYYNWIRKIEKNNI